ncbi:unnamed protein product, partial [Ostreobium quekettii]
MAGDGRDCGEAIWVHPDGGSGRRRIVREGPAHVVLIDPPCLVAGRACAVDVRMSRDVDAKLVGVDRDGQPMAGVLVSTEVGRKF